MKITRIRAVRTFGVQFYIGCIRINLKKYNSQEPGIAMKRKFKQWWSTIPPISTTTLWTITSHLHSLNTEKEHDHMKWNNWITNIWVSTLINIKEVPQNYYILEMYLVTYILKPRKTIAVKLYKMSFKIFEFQLWLISRNTLRFLRKMYLHVTLILHFWDQKNNICNME